MPRPPFVDFPLDPVLRSVLEPCLDRHDVGSAKAEWPNNILSTKTVVYGSGRIGRAGEAITHSVDPDELDLIKRLAHDVAKVMQGVPVGMGSNSSDFFHEFYSAGNVDDPRLTKIDAKLIRARFGGTIFPPATITLEPFAEAGTWWDEVVASVAGDSRALYPWRSLIHWFRTQPDFIDTAFVRIGDDAALRELTEKENPAGTEMPGCVLPRLALGLTRGGSLAGLFGYSVLA